VPLSRLIQRTLPHPPFGKNVIAVAIKRGTPPDRA